MLIAQITDVHVGFDRDGAEDRNLARLATLLDRVARGPNRPDAVLITGDLTEHGDADSFRRLAEMLAAHPAPIHLIPGNHDDRAALLAAFPETPVEDGFVMYPIDLGELRVLMLDTLEPGVHGGAFCDRRADWLSRQLAAAPTRPTVIAMHHPPAPTGIAWMDPDPAAPWIARFDAAVRGHDQIVGVLCGHVHRPVATRWRGSSLIVAPSCAPAIALDLSPVDPAQPDGRALIRCEPPAYALHAWRGGAFVSHFEAVGGFHSLARFDDSLQPMMRTMMAGRPPR